ncbi:uncharacterized protein YktA (UPF0223 family) [Enterococcus sp. PF1-24]|uniref:UPF0223 family protein n=1 Tax=unclassified Enterococcus TaxID=2608891 RepID=UPI002475AA49|nr:MULTISPECIES: UPF0223 family protein [unclassified Enterococcus]MDH6364218.1 uncharacterized protein YktA (UPF0223 family) [Enterococcus sp. PFB1-1]MDH6401319.1 uncharacterized protein YktA (UPF0223 family) [Enterococcus sp. PF1-24]
MKDYQYPLDIEWTTAEMVTVVAMWSALEAAYEKGIPVKDFLAAYGEFKTVVKSIGEEKRLGREFEKLSGYALYPAVKAAQSASQKVLKMKG